MKRRLGRIGLRVIGGALVLVVVWLVGWQDTVVDRDGGEHRGELVRVGATEAVLRTEDGERILNIEGPTAVRRGLRGAFRRLAAAPGDAALAWLCLIVSMALIQVRWLVHARGADLVISWREAFRLGWIGMFFNQLLPAGQTGGDLVKAFIFSRHHPERRTMAVVSVFADRGTGLFVLSLVSTAAVLLAPSGSRIDLARNIALGFFVFCLLFLGLLMTPRLRQPLRISRLLAKLPLGRLWTEIAHSFDVYGRRPRVVARGVLVGLAVHAFWLATFWFLAAAMGVRLTPLALFVAIPVAMMAGAIPGLPAGWGYGDMAFYFFLPVAGVPPATAVAISFSFRILMMLISLPGGLLLARSRGHDPATD